MNTNRRSRTLRWILGTGLAAFVFSGCAHEDPKATRSTTPGLGDEIFGVLCDRVGAQALREDLSGSSYHEICHGSATTVDTSHLPAAADQNVRSFGIAKIEMLARHRPALVAALDVVFPDDQVVGKNLDTATASGSCQPVSGKLRRDQLRGLLDRLIPVDNETLPESSRAIAQSIEPLMSPDKLDAKGARVAMARLAARRGYMPPDLAGGLAGNLLGAPRLRDFLDSTMHLVSPNSTPFDQPNKHGIAYDTLKAFAAAMRSELKEPADPPEPPLVVTRDDASGRNILSRPRTTLELLREVLLTQDPAFSNGPPLFVARRDRRGVAVVAKVDGRIPAPFIDVDHDGLADIDDLGRLITKANGKAGDPFTGDERDPRYEYIDARATAGSALLRHLAPLADPDGGKESLLATVEAMEPFVRDPEGREVLLDLVHAVVQVAADPSSDDLFGLIGQLAKAQPQLLARIAGNLLDMKATLDAHPEAAIPKGSTLVDDLLDVLVKVSREPGLLEDVLASLADDRAVYMQTALPPILKFRDRMTYDRNNINGPPMNRELGVAAPPSTLVNRQKKNTGLDRSIFQRFLQIVGDTNGVTACNKEGGVLNAIIPHEVFGEINTAAPLVCTAPAPLCDEAAIKDLTRPMHCVCPDPSFSPECGLFKIENLSEFYLQAIAGGLGKPGKGLLHFRDETVTENISPQALRKALGLDGLWPSEPKQDVRPQPALLNRLVFFDVANDSPFAGQKNFRTNTVIEQLQGAHVGSAACAERVIDDPLSAPGVKIRGLRTCQDGQYIDQRNPDTIFALEYNHGYEALAPLAEAFVKHDKESLLVELLSVLGKHWSVDNGVVNAEPALADILAGDLAISLHEMAKATNDMKVVRCAASSTTKCDSPTELKGPQVLAEGLRSIIDPDSAYGGSVMTRKGRGLASGKAMTLLGLLREAFDEQEAFFQRDPKKHDQWLAARSRIVDEFLTVKGRGPEAQFVDPGIGQLVPVVGDLLRSQRVAKCRGTLACHALRQDVVTDLESSLNKNITKLGLDLLDFILQDAPARRELGLMTSYLTRQSDPLAGAGDVVGSASAAASPSATPFANLRGPGVLDKSIAALVDALGALGDLSEVNALNPMLANALEHLDPQLDLLSRLNARAFDGVGNELCSKELDPEEVVAGALSRLALPIKVPGQPRRTALQIILEAIADVNRLDPALDTPLDQADYANVVKNTHELLTDPTSGLEQLYASVKNAVEH